MTIKSKFQTLNIKDMNLETEAERKEAFVKVYGDKYDFITNPFSGPHKTGFDLCTFDTENNYALWVSRGNNPELLAYRDFAMDRILPIPIQRKRYFSGKNLNMASSEISYPQGDNLIEWYFLLDQEQKYLSFKRINLIIYTSRETGKIPLIRCSSRSRGKVPDNIFITKDPPESIVTSYQSAPKWVKRDVPNSLFLCKANDAQNPLMLVHDNYQEEKPFGSFHIGEKFENNGLSVSIGLPDSFHFLLSMINKNSNSHLELDAPIIGYSKLHQALEGNWQEFASFPRRYPVKFQLHKSKQAERPGRTISNLLSFLKRASAQLLTNKFTG
ncbi:MAG: hypothetical protein PHQ59_05060 [Candidatus Daviesbacteria bacterium]|nr:hypothetical protein [Candidatus Daviesbacteria bacterium]